MQLHILALFRGYPPSFQSARNLFRSPFPASFAKPFTGSTAPTFPAIRCFPFPAAKHSPSYRQRKRSRTSLGMTLREYRSLTLPIYFPCNNDTREAPSTFAALLFFMRRTPPEPDNLNPKPTTKKPQPKLELFVSERLICQTVRAWCLLLLQYQ